MNIPKELIKKAVRNLILVILISFLVITVSASPEYNIGTGKTTTIQNIFNNNTINNITIINGSSYNESYDAKIGGAGTYGYIPVFNGTSSINNSIIYQSTNKIDVNGLILNKGLNVTNNATGTFYGLDIKNTYVKEIHPTGAYIDRMYYIVPDTGRPALYVCMTNLTIASCGKIYDFYMSNAVPTLNYNANVQLLNNRFISAESEDVGANAALIGMTVNNVVQLGSSYAATVTGNETTFPTIIYYGNRTHDDGAAGYLNIIKKSTAGDVTVMYCDNKGRCGIGTTTVFNALFTLSKSPGNYELNISGFVYVNSTNNQMLIGTTPSASTAGRVLYVNGLLEAGTMRVNNGGYWSNSVFEFGDNTAAGARFSNYYDKPIRITSGADTGLIAKFQRRSIGSIYFNNSLCIDCPNARGTRSNLDVYVGESTPHIEISTNRTNGAEIYFTDEVGGFARGAIGAFPSTVDGDTGYLKFTASDSGTLYEAMRIYYNSVNISKETNIAAKLITQNITSLNINSQSIYADNVTGRLINISDSNGIGYYTVSNPASGKSYNVFRGQGGEGKVAIFSVLKTGADKEASMQVSEEGTGNEFLFGIRDSGGFFQASTGAIRAEANGGGLNDFYGSSIWAEGIYVVWDGASWQNGLSQTFDTGSNSQIVFIGGIATSISTAYDANLMTNITYLGSNPTTELTPITFNWNKQGLSQMSAMAIKPAKVIGYTAQDVEKFYPDCVFQENLTGFKTIAKPFMVNKTLTVMRNITSQIVTPTIVKNYRKDCVSAYVAMENSKLKANLTAIDNRMKIIETKLNITASKP